MDHYNNCCEGDPKMLYKTLKGPGQGKKLDVGLDMISFGDNNNDIEMLTGSGLGIAMSNAKERVKEAAHRVSEWSNDDDGVVRELERLGMIPPSSSPSASPV